MYKARFITSSKEQTQKLAFYAAGLLNENSVITLKGDLGAGKTTFAQGIAKGLGIDGVVNSPTFNIVKCYFNGKMPFYHIDAYRLEGIVQDLGWDEYFEGKGVSLIEWPQYIEYTLPEDYLTIEIEIIDDNTRSITFISDSTQYETLIKEVEKYADSITD